MEHLLPGKTRDSCFLIASLYGITDGELHQLNQASMLIARTCRRARSCWLGRAPSAAPVSTPGPPPRRAHPPSLPTPFHLARPRSVYCFSTTSMATPSGRRMSCHPGRRDQRDRDRRRIFGNARDGTESRSEAYAASASVTCPRRVQHWRGNTRQLQSHHEPDVHPGCSSR